MKKNDIKDLPETTNHVNGWPVIRQYLTSSRITQTALAAHLRITPSAITQIKQGLFLLNAAQLRKTADFLKMDEKGITAFYTQIFRGRLLAGNAPELQNFSLAVTAPAEKNAMYRSKNQQPPSSHGRALPMLPFCVSGMMETNSSSVFTTARHPAKRSC